MAMAVLKKAILQLTRLLAPPTSLCSLVRAPQDRRIQLVTKAGDRDSDCRPGASHNPFLTPSASH